MALPRTQTGFVVYCGASGGRDEDRRRSAVADGRAHQAGERLRHQRRRQYLLEGVLFAVLRVRVQAAVVVVLHRDLRELLLRRPVALHVGAGARGVDIHEHAARLARLACLPRCSFRRFFRLLLHEGEHLLRDLDVRARREQGVDARLILRSTSSPCRRPAQRRTCRRPRTARRVGTPSTSWRRRSPC